MYNSQYWSLEIEKTNIEISRLLMSEDTHVIEIKSDEDTIKYQPLKDRIKSLREYLSHCHTELRKCLDVENKTDNKPILYFGREYGY